MFMRQRMLVGSGGFWTNLSVYEDGDHVWTLSQYSELKAKTDPHYKISLKSID